MDTESVLDGQGGLERLLQEFAAAGRVQLGTDDRRAQHWLTSAALDAATLAGTLVDLGESGAQITLGTRSGRRLRGRLAVVASDFVLLSNRDGASLLRTAAIESIEPEPGTRTSLGGDRSPLSLRFVDALSLACADRPRVLAVGAGANRATAGEVRSVGSDLVTIRVDGTPRRTVHLAVRALDECYSADFAGMVSG